MGAVTTHVSTMFLRDTRHGGPVRQPQKVATKLASFVAAATKTLDVAIYDFRLDGAPAETVVEALKATADRGVTVRIAFDAGKPAAETAEAFTLLEADPAPIGTADWVSAQFGGTPVETKPISAPSGQLMHSKYLIRDSGTAGAAIWTGSANFTNDAWTLQENNIVTVVSGDLATAYGSDFDQMWTSGAIKGTGAQDTGTTTVGSYPIGWDFAPGDGTAIDVALTAQVRAAKKRIVIATMVLTSHPVLAALAAAIDRGVAVSGIYDSGQMGPIVKVWKKNATKNAELLANWKRVSAVLADKRSTPYTPTSKHDFLHHKVLVADTTVITGSYNFSANAQQNAENQLRIRSSSLSARFVTEIAAIVAEYSH
jgi:phosphatidylserine/phosphatidylglycerophosphate/cardiolipin synthase-like enzyme